TAYEMDLAWWCLNDSTEKEENVGKVENKVSCKDSKPDANCETSLLEWFWDNADCNDFVKEVENMKESAVKASDEKESGENEKKEDVSGLYSIGHCDDEKKKIKRDENKILTCYQNTSNIDKDKKQMLEQNSEYVEGGELLVEPKVEDENRLVFDREKLIKSRNTISDIYCDEEGAKIGNCEEVIGNERPSGENNVSNVIMREKIVYYYVQSVEIRKAEVNEHNIPEVGVKNDENGDKAADGRAKIIRSEMESVERTCDESIKNNKYYEFHDKKSSHDEYLARDCELVIKIERNQRDSMHVKNKTDMKEYNRKKSKQLKVKIDDVDNRKMKHEKNII
ncbi:17700_t:CDS:2, partial [Racocetra fulgida]